MKRLLTAAGLLVASSLAVAEAPEAGTLEVYKSPTCGCCEKWADHMRDNGFDVVTHDVQNLQPIKEKAQLRPGLGSCHTAFIDGYAIEGHDHSSMHFSGQSSIRLPPGDDDAEQNRRYVVQSAARGQGNRDPASARGRRGRAAQRVHAARGRLDGDCRRDVLQPEVKARE